MTWGPSINDIQKVLKIKKRHLFLFFTSHVAKNSWKKPICIILCFLVGKWGVLSRGTPHLDPYGVSTGTPAFDPPLSNLKTQNYCSFDFSNCFPQLLLEKRETNNYSFLVYFSRISLKRFLPICYSHVILKFDSSD